MWPRSARFPGAGPLSFDVVGNRAWLRLDDKLCQVAAPVASTDAAFRRQQSAAVVGAAATAGK
eukprot:4123061-Prymnesium_polylepis.1